MMTRVAELPIDRAEDVFALRQSGRVAAAAIGCDEADQVRLATALSEIGREIVTNGVHSSVSFSVEDDGTLVVTIARFPRIENRSVRVVTGLDAARRLLDVTTSESGDGSIVVSVVLRRTPSAPLRRVTAASVRKAMKALSPALGLLDELRLENRNLVSTLEELRAKQEALVTLNAELEQTNRGVMAMYGQLADELDETNRGVVALYSELDDKTVKLNQASEAKSRFLANVSHELRSPLNSILGLARLLLDQPEDGLAQEQRRQLELIVGSGRELLRLVNDLLDLAKAEAGRLQPEPAVVDLGEIFVELRGALRPLVRPGVELCVEIFEPIVIETDRALLVHVLRNLLTNALKFTSRGSVALTAQAPTTYEIVISVVDTGIGIAPEHQRKIFEEFFQVRGPLQAEHKGTGLGLTFAHRVTEALGGTLTLESEAGVGTTFTVRLPKVWQPLLRAKESPGRQLPADVKLGTVLIVDDDETFRTVLRGMLQGTASQVLEANGGNEGLKIMRNARPDLVFIDLRMPDLDGASVLLEMDDDPELRAIPAVIVSSVDFTTPRRASIPHAAEMLSKVDLNPESVRRVVAKVLARPGTVK